MPKKKEIKPSVTDTIKAIRDKFGDDAIMRMDEQPLVGVDSIPTGSFGLDMALGIGGLPRGRVTEIYGPESSGKTTLALHVIAEAQKLNKDSECAYIDVEHAMDPEYAKKIGVNTSKLFISQPDSAEQALSIVETMVQSNTFDVIVIDSVAALVPKDEGEGEMGQQFMGKQARLMGQAMRKLIPVTAKSKTVLIFINQVRTMMNVMPGQSTETTPGGRALKFAASVRIDIRRIAQIKKGEETVGGRVKVKVVKNKVSAPAKTTEFDLMFGEGISKEGELLAMGEKVGVITKSGQSYAYGLTPLGRGYDASRKFLKADQELSIRIMADIKAGFSSVQLPASTEENNNTE
jgi:recombination protein RecA